MAGRPRYSLPHLEMRACDWQKSCHVTYTRRNMHTNRLVTDVEVIIGKYFPEV